ncbi:MAG TPA: extracellular solute-binding protein [Dermatophilaceae bacterium]|nr:extracellular solute-binding protein [Dermatophilaceae bacterium]
MSSRQTSRATWAARVTALLGTGALALTACGGGFNSGTTQQATSSGPVKLQLMIASSGDAETNAVRAATDAWAKKSGNSVEVIVASDIGQQLGQAFAGGKPPDVFYTDASRIGDFAKAGNLYAYGDKVADQGFIDSLVQTFTYAGKLQCAPKDYSTLALIINTEMWSKAGLTDADIPKDWAGLETVAKKLTKGGVTGLVTGRDINRLGVFMKQAGGWVVSADGKSMTADTPENLAGLQEAKKLMTAGSYKFDKAVDAGWGGEAIGKKKAAMTIEGNWIVGVEKDFPDLKYQAVELPAGPKGKGTLLFSQCWGIAAKSPNQAVAVDLVKSLVSVDQQMSFAKAFGVMPSTKAGIEQYKTQFPDKAAFANGGEYGQGPVNLPGFDPVMAAFNSKLEQLGSADPKPMLAELQKNGEAALKEQ